MHFHALVALLPLASASLLVARDQAYLDSVCSPNGTFTGTTIPPCISSATIQTACNANNTTPLGLLAHAECMCDAPSSFFADWIGCRDCLLAHGGLNQDAFNRWTSVIGIVSKSLCTGTPTAVFSDIFTSVDATVAQVTNTASGTDKYVSSTAVSLYYTASGSQGVGVITGSATAATSIASSTSTGAKSSGNSGSGTTTKSGSGSAATAGGTSSSKAGAVPTAAAGKGVAFAAAGVGMLVLAGL